MDLLGNEWIVNKVVTIHYSLKTKQSILPGTGYLILKINQ